MNGGRVAHALARTVGCAHILLIDDEPAAGVPLATILETEGFAVAHERLGRTGLGRASSDAFDLIVLDLVLPDADGLDILRALRIDGVLTRVLVLTSRGSIADRVAGLNSGADDYVVKPFASSELMARIRALLRRATAQQTRLRVADLELDC